MASLLRLALMVTLFAFAFLTGRAYAEDGYSGPEAGESLDPEDLAVEGEDPAYLEGESGDPNDLVAESRDADNKVGGSEDPDEMVMETEGLDEHGGRSYELDDLPQDDSSDSLPDPMPRLVARPESPGVDDGPEVRAAWRAVEAAERDMEASNDIYANMIDANYPRGERRVQIIEERRAAFERVNETRSHYLELRAD